MMTFVRKYVLGRGPARDTDYRIRDTDSRVRDIYYPDVSGIIIVYVLVCTLHTTYFDRSQKCALIRGD